jgi:hypothetical protein
LNLANLQSIRALEQLNHAYTDAIYFDGTDVTLLPTFGEMA